MVKARQAGDLEHGPAAPVGVVRLVLCLGRARLADLGDGRQRVQQDDAAQAGAERDAVRLGDRVIVPPPHLGDQPRAVEADGRFKFLGVGGEVGHDGSTGRDMKCDGGVISTVVTAG